MKVTWHKRFPEEIDPTYFHATVRRGRAKLDRSGLEGAIKCDECVSGIKRITKVVIDLGSWDGLDVFIARGLPGTIMASERFAKFWRENAFTNAVLLPAEQYSYDFRPWEKNDTESI